MNISPAKENILKKIRQALSNSTPLPFPLSEGNNSVFQPSRQELEVEFAGQFVKLQGKFIFCVDQHEVAAQLAILVKQKNWNNVYCDDETLSGLLKEAQFGYSSNDLAGSDVAITKCDFLIARTGTIILSSAQPCGRTSSVYSPVHICIAKTDQLVYDIREGLQLLKGKYSKNLPSLVTFASGPSRTADIEKTLVVGVHGPKEVYVFLADELE